MHSISFVPVFRWIALLGRYVSVTQKHKLQPSKKDFQMKKLLQFLTSLEKRNIHYQLEHNRDEFIMVNVAIPGERWEVEFSLDGEIEIEIFKNSKGVFTDEKLLRKLLEAGK